MKAFIVACLFGFALCAPQLGQKQKQQLLLDPVEDLPPIPYNFGLQVSDDETTNYQTRQESQDEHGNVQGQFSWVGPDGFRYITTYSASPETGFQAKTEKEATDIVVIIPQPKPEFQLQQQQPQQKRV
ncbi:UNVERIFIED_CONTAM: hypothetical protein RMT77_018068 [Armadillidium vulgare]